MAFVNWQEIDTVLLDMDGTLLDLRFDNYFWQQYVIEVYAQTHNEDLDEAREHINQLVDDQRGTLNWYCLDYWSEQLRLDLVELKYAVRKRIAIRPGSVDFLRWLNAQNKEVILCTNAHPATVAIKLKETMIEPWFDHVVSSHVFGAPKEAPEFWQAFSEVSSFTKARTMFVDDSLSVLKAAQQFGIAHCIAIDKPDSEHPANATEGFKYVRFCSELIDQQL